MNKSKYFNEQAARKWFERHVAVKKDYGPVTIIDFKAPDTNEYRIRFLFENDYYRLHISGDLGALSASNYTNMRYETFYKDFTRDPGYFYQKIDAMERPAFTYDEDAAKCDLIEYMEERHISEEELIEMVESSLLCYGTDLTFNEAISALLENFDDETGLSRESKELIAEIDPDFWLRDANMIGKIPTGIIDLYLLAYKLAYEQLQENEQ